MSTHVYSQALHTAASIAIDLYQVHRVRVGETTEIHMPDVALALMQVDPSTVTASVQDQLLVRRALGSALSADLPQSADGVAAEPVIAMAAAVLGEIARAQDMVAALSGILGMADRYDIEESLCAAE